MRYDNIDKKFQESEKLYRMLFDYSMDGIILTDPRDGGKILSANPAACRMLGWAEEELIGKGREVMFDLEDPALSSLLDERARSGSVRTQLTYRRKDGTTFPGEVSTAFFTDDNGEPRAVAIIRDITERKHAEQALSESEMRFRTMFEAHGAPMLLIEPGSGKIIDANDAAVRFYEYSREQLRAMHIDEINQLPPEEVTAERYKAVERGRNVFIFRHRLASNDIRWVEVYSSPVKIKGQPILFSIIHDITERKQAEEALRNSEERYRMLFTNMTEAFFLGEPIYDKDGKPCSYRFLEVNPAFELQTGLNRKQLLGKTIHEVVNKPNSLAIEEYGKITLTGKPTHFEIFSKELNRYLDGYIFSPENGKFAVIFRDITERKKLEEQIRQRAEELEIVMDVAPVAIWIGHDLQGHKITGNRMANEYYEAETGENVSADAAPMRRFFHNGKELTANELPMQQASLKNIRVHNMEVDVLLPSGECKTFLGSASPLHDTEGHVRGSVGAFTDITERKKAEEALRKSEEHYRMLFTNMTEGFLLAEIISDEDGKPHDYRYLEINPVYEYSTGLKKEQVLGKSILDIVPNVSPILIKKLGETAVSGEPTYFEIFSQIVGKYFDTYVFSPGKGMVAATFRDITKRKQAEEALRESEEKYRTIVETASEGIWTADHEARTTYANEKMAAMLGYTQEEMIGRPVCDFTSGEDKIIARRNMEKREKGIDESYEIKLIRKDGSPLWAFANGKALFDKKGKFTGSIALITDITARKEAEAKLKETLDNLEKLVKERTAELENAYNSLKESEKSLAEAQRMAHLGNWNWNIITDKIYWSDEAYRIFGLKPQESGINLGTFLNYVHPDDREYVNNAAKKALSRGSYSTDFRIILADGEERIIHAHGEVSFNEKKTPVWVRGTIQDITGQKKTEEKIRRLADIVESSNDAIITKSLEGIITSWNKGAEQVYGYSADEILGKNISILEPASLRGEIERLTQKIIDNKDIKHYDTLRLKKDGTLINVSVTLSPILNSSGKLVAISAIARDITERKKAEEALAKLEKIRIKEIHHRIKNNLQVISSLLDLQSEAFSHLEVCKVPEVIEAFTESQNRVISMALIHEELYKGDKIDTLDFAAYLRKLTEDLFSSYNLGDKDINFKLDLEQVDLGMDTAIPLGIIVNELVSNAFKHAFPDRREGEIKINLSRIEPTVAGREIPDPDKHCMEKDSFRYKLGVSDNGKGIPEGINLVNTDSLGLQLVSLLVEQIDGCVGLKIDNGTEFTIWFNNMET
ncbi:PAS domain S-box protein [Methanosarcina sp. MSH10X1]|uniref:PAS domain S-box protein n=1 Tax=Methanosarcina sp. MSH10X1 TaxID=2507075 RepID=UPI000FFBED25|nr:PAS domain S-box protein [Methanosarcina sp. MSH10X1]RXA21870.1 PAS domain S-box protein [Methanosarcina sp. MSH10X1]